MFCRRPAVSIITTSTSPSIPALTASKATEAGSAPSTSDLTVATPTRCPQVANWSAAAARKVSAAPRMTSLFSATSTRASLPTVVVLPTPLTPTTMTTAGRSAWRSTASERSRVGSTSLMSSSRSSSRTSAGLRLPITFTRSRRASTNCRVGSVPRSASSSVSSISSQTSSSILSRESSINRPLPRALFDFERRSRSRTSRPAAGSGVSTWISSSPARSSSTGAVEDGSAPGFTVSPGGASAGRSSVSVPPGAGSLASRGLV